MGHVTMMSWVPVMSRSWIPVVLLLSWGLALLWLTAKKHHLVENLMGIVTIVGSCTIVGRSHGSCNCHGFWHSHQVEDLMSLVIIIGSVTITEDLMGLVTIMGSVTITS